MAQPPPAHPPAGIRDTPTIATVGTGVGENRAGVGQAVQRRIAPPLLALLLILIGSQMDGCRPARPQPLPKRRQTPPPTGAQDDLTSIFGTGWAAMPDAVGAAKALIRRQITLISRDGRYRQAVRPIHRIATFLAGSDRFWLNQHRLLGILVALDHCVSGVVVDLSLIHI